MGSVCMPKMEVEQKRAPLRKASVSMPTMVVQAASPSSGPQRVQRVANLFSGAGSRSTGGCGSSSEVSEDTDGSTRMLAISIDDDGGGDDNRTRETQHKAATRHEGGSAPPRMYQDTSKTRQRSRSVPSMEAGRITRQPRRGEEGALHAAHVPAQQTAVPRQSSRQISSGGTSHLNNPVTQFLLDRASP